MSKLDKLKKWYVQYCGQGLKLGKSTNGKDIVQKDGKYYYQSGETLEEISDGAENAEVAKLLKNASQAQSAGAFFGVNVDSSKSASTQQWQAALGSMGAITSKATNLVGDAVLNNADFDAQSLAIDGAVDATSDALMKSGNPYAMAAAGVMQFTNLMTKIGGQTVDGFDVTLNTGGYSSKMAHQDSKAHRSVLGLLGVPITGPTQLAKLDKELEERNEKALMAMNAANIESQQQLNNEASNNSVMNTIEQNKIALSGGVDLGALSAKRGAKLIKLGGYLQDVYGKPHKIALDLNDDQENGLEPIETTDGAYWVLDKLGHLISLQDIYLMYGDTAKLPTIKAQNGAKLKQIEVSEPNILPTGAMHKDKNHLTELLEAITSKGIPVVTVDDDSIETYKEVIELKDSIVQHAEIERTELIFSKSLTDYLEQAKEDWIASNKTDNELVLEVGKRITKELLFNTIDEDKVIKTAMKNGKS